MQEPFRRIPALADQAQAFRRGKSIISMHPFAMINQRRVPAKHSASGEGSNLDSTNQRPSPSLPNQTELATMGREKGIVAYLTYIWAPSTAQLGSCL